MRTFLIVGGIALGLSALGCGSGESGDDAGPDDPMDAGSVVADGGLRRDGGPPPPTPDGGGGDDDDAGSPIDAGPPPPRLVGSCADPVPEGAPTPDPLPTYAGGACPTLAPGRNTIRSSDLDRQFLLVIPSDLDATTEQLPLLFMWHWLGGDAQDFVDRGDVQRAADEMRLIAVVPESTDAYEVAGAFDPKWPYMNPHTDAQVDQEVRFFDDMLACVAEQYPIQRHCVSSAGVSAGALWTAQLVQRRANLIASFISLSGGVGDGSGGLFDQVRPWSGAARPLPGLVLWGGDSDSCYVINFRDASMALEAGMVADGHYLVECVHNCGHSVPPVEAPPGESGFASIWRFALDHPYWLSPGASPWQDAGLPASTPSWCAEGAGSATPRTGTGCDASGC